MNYLVEYGFSPSLANLELASVLSREKIKFKKTTLSPKFVLIQPNNKLDHLDLVRQLGGVVRIAQLFVNTKPQRIVEVISQDLFQQNQDKINFSLTSIEKSEDLTQLNQKVKLNLKKQNKNSRFVLPRSNTLTPLKISSQTIQEYILVRQGHQISIYKTVAVSPVLSWQQRDRNRPAVDPKSGMLPPKVARIMVNLALDQPPGPQTVLYDPFCGSGTILAEALVSGVSVIGSDISAQAISDTKANLEWLQNHFKTPGKSYLFQQDVNQLDQSSFSRSVDGIVTEVDLGPPDKLTPNQIQETVLSLENIYSQALPRLKAFLKPGKKLVVALPEFNHPDSVKSLASLIDTCENSGYTHLAGPIKYSKPQAQVKRAITVFKKHK